MINLMTQNISYFIKNNMLKKNEEDEENINKDIINKFIGDYKNLLTDEEFINYIVGILAINLKSFYKNDIIKISNASHNLIYNSDIINNIKQFMIYYKNKTKEIIGPIIESCAIDFIDKLFVTATEIDEATRTEIIDYFYYMYDRALLESKYSSNWQLCIQHWLDDFAETKRT